MSQPALSIVVIGRNEEARLGPTFESLRAIPMDYEVLYVDSASEDRSVDVAALLAILRDLLPALRDRKSVV